MIGSILSAALRFRTLIVGVAAGLMVLGVLSLRQMHSDVVPELASGPVLEVQTEALGLSSAEVEQYVTVPMENNLLDGIMGVWDERSDSLPGLSSVDLYFEPGTTVLHARQLVQERLTNAFALPNVSKPPLLIQPLSTSGRVMMIGLTSTKLSSLELSYLARWVIKPRLSGVPGVANVAIFGQEDRQIQVLADPSRLASHHVTLSQIIQTAGNAQLVSPLSYLEGSAPGTGGFLDGPNQRLEIRPVLPLGAPQDLAGVPITGAAGKQPLGSVANVVQSHQPLIGQGLVGGSTGLVLMVQKLPSASVRGVTDGIDQALGQLKPALPGVRIDSSLFRPAGYTAEATHNLAVAAVIAAALALLALGALFLSARAVFVSFVSVAVSMIVAAWVLEALGYTLNPLVVVGLLVALVVLVDDATAATHDVVERLRARTRAGSGERIQDVIFDACAPLRSTLGYATLLILLAIVPVFVSKGVTATFVHPMLLAFALAVIASLVVALTLTPALTMLLYDRGRPSRERPGFASLPAVAYRRVVGVALCTPRPVLIATCLVGLAGVVSLPVLGEPSPPAFADRNLVVQWDGPAGTSLTEMNRITSRVVGQLRAVPGVGDVGATLGRAVSSDQVVDTNAGQIYVTIKPQADYDGTVAAVRSVVGSTPGMQADVSTYEHNVMNGVLTPATNQVDVRVYGENYPTLDRLASQVASVMSRVRGVGQATVHLERQEPDIEVAVNATQALRAGVLPGDARRDASTLVSGLAVGNFFEQQAVFDVVVVGAPSVRQNLPAVRNLLIDTSGGNHVRLGSIAEVSIHHNPLDVQHDAFSRFVDVTANLHGTDRSSVQDEINTQLQRLSFPLEYHAEVVGGTPNDPTSHAAFLSYLVASLLGVLLLLQAAVGSWRLAALLFVAQPVALSGGVLVAALSGNLSSLGTVAGLLAVLAFSVRHGLLLITHIRRRHTADGGPLDRAIVTRAATERLTPVLGVAVVLAAAMVPFVVMGNAAGNELTHTTAAVILGGLLTSSLINLLVLPAVYFVLGPVEAVVAQEPETATLRASPAPTPSS
jgi:Cu/Ag efflux pump CusA